MVIIIMRVIIFGCGNKENTLFSIVVFSIVFASQFFYSSLFKYNGDYNNYDYK